MIWTVARRKKPRHRRGNQEEDAINMEMAAMLRAKGWVTESERTDRVVGSSGAKPDIIVESGGNAVIVETEYMPARTLERDVLDRRNIELRGIGQPAGVVGVVVPERMRRLPGGSLPGELAKASDFEYYTYEQDGPRFPESGVLKGSMADIATAISLMMVPRRRVDECVSLMDKSIDKISASIMSAPGTVVDGIAKELKIPRNRGNDDETVWQNETGSMAGFIMLNAGIFYEELASHVGEIVPTQQLGSIGILDQSTVVKEWEHICSEIDYCPVFKIAAKILSRLPGEQAGVALAEMGAAVSKISALRVQKSGDVYGMLYQDMLEGRENAAAFYTRPEAATLLAGLVMPPSGDAMWDDTDTVRSWRIADFACGTGMLLTAAYQHIMYNFRANPAEMHAHIMEECMYGYDIMPTAVHLTVSNLAGLQPGQAFDDTHVHIMPIGRDEVRGGFGLGSLDLIRDMETIVEKGEREGGRGAKETKKALAAHKSCDYILMNPPFVAATNHEGGREYRVPPFALFGISPDDQTAMARHLKPMYRGTCAHGNAGLGSYFAAIADKKIKNGGTVGLILPNTVMTGTSWDKVRAMLNRWYDDITLVQVGLSTEDGDNRDWGRTYSSDTGMNETMLVARKREHERVNGDWPRIRLVLLDRMPRSRLEALETARAVKLAEPVRLEDGAGHRSIMVGDTVVGKVVDCPVEADHWWVARVSDVYLLYVMYDMMHNGVGSLNLTTLDDIARMGKIDRDLTGNKLKKNGEPRGPFNKVPAGPHDTYPCLWYNRVNAGEQKVMLAPPDCALEPKRNATEKAKEVWRTATRLHVNRGVDFRSQRLAAAYTREPTLGGRTWPNVIVDEAYEKPIAVWCNSSLGMLVYYIVSADQQRGRGTMTKTAFQGFPVPDFRTADSDTIAKLGRLFDEYCAREMLPVNRMDQDMVRIGLDTRMAEILGIEWDLGYIRRKLTTERQFGRKDVSGGA